MMRRNPRSTGGWVDTRRPANRTHILSRSRIAWWLNVKNWRGGPVIPDLTGTTPGIPHGGVAWNSTERGGGEGTLGFNGSSSYVGLPGLSLPGPMTVACWVRFASIGSHQALIWDNDVSGQIGVRVNTGGSLDWFQGGGGIGFSQVFGANRWYHFVLTRSGSSGSWPIHFYVNGVEEGSSPQTVTTDPPSSPVDLRLGASSAFGFPLGGDMDDIAVYNRAISKAEAAAMFAVSSQRNRPDVNWLLPSSRRSFGSSGGGSDSGIGSVTVGHGTAAGAGQLADNASGSPSLAHTAASGGGAVTDTGSGSPTLGHVIAAGAGGGAGSGSGAPVLSRVTAAGTGATADAGGGSPNLGHVIAAGSGSVTDSGSGVATLRAVIASGSDSGIVSGSGSPSLTGVTASGTGSITDIGSGGPTLGRVTAIGTGTAVDPDPPSDPVVRRPRIAVIRRRRLVIVPPPPLVAGPIRQAVLAALLADTSLTSIVGVNIAPVNPKEKLAPPSLTYRLIQDKGEYTLDGPLGKSRALIRFTARSRNQADCVALEEALRNAFDGYASNADGPLGGIAWIDWTLEQDEDDVKDEPVDGTDRGIFETRVAYLFRYRQPQPVR